MTGMADSTAAKMWLDSGTTNAKCHNVQIRRRLSVVATRVLEDCEFVALDLQHERSRLCNFEACDE